MRPVRTLLRDHGIRPARSLGQNFLKDKGIVERIVKLAGVERGDHVVEFGAGHGLLTEALARKAARVWAFEIDVRLVEFLRADLAAFPNVDLIHADALEYAEHVPDEAGFKVVANLPFSVASPLLLLLLEDGRFESLCLMVQLEVARRIVAPRGTRDYGFLSVICQSTGSAEIAWEIGAEHFVPRPKVDAAVVLLQKSPERAGLIQDRMDFRRLVSAAFRHRRKTLLNSLRRAEPALQLDEDRVQALLSACGATSLSRAQELTVDQFVRLSNVYTEMGIGGGMARERR